MRNFHKLDMASAEWLTTHFRAKSASRLRALADLPIEAGDKILDLCCGPGLYMPYLLDLAGPTGQVTGLDQDPISLDVAHHHLSSSKYKNWRLVHSSVDDHLTNMSDYNVIILFNSIGYFPNPRSLIASIADRLNAPARIIIKDFDLEGFFFQPRSTEMWSRLILAAKHRNDTDNPVMFDNFFGRFIFSLNTCYSFKAFDNFLWTQTMSYPFSDDQQEYIWRNVECLINQAGASCPEVVSAYFKKLLYPPTPTFFSDEHAIFIENEFLTVLQL